MGGYVSYEMRDGTGLCFHFYDSRNRVADNSIVMYRLVFFNLKLMRH